MILHLRYHLIKDLTFRGLKESIAHSFLTVFLDESIEFETLPRSLFVLNQVIYKQFN